jgi:hypothetical protein
VGGMETVNAELRYRDQIDSYRDLASLAVLWESIKGDVILKEWPSGKAFEYMVLRAFELSGAEVQYSFSVDLFEVKGVEQIDGFISLPNYGLNAIVESKDWVDTIPIGPMAKMRSQLLRRPSALVGAFFTASSFTNEAILLAHFFAPQIILLWTGDDIDYCFENSYFLQGMAAKYGYALREGKPDFALRINDPNSKASIKCIRLFSLKATRIKPYCKVFWPSKAKMAWKSSHVPEKGVQLHQPAR